MDSNALKKLTRAVISTAATAMEAVKMLQQHKKQDLPVSDDDIRLQGIVSSSDLLQAGVA